MCVKNGFVHYACSHVYGPIELPCQDFVRCPRAEPEGIRYTQEQLEQEHHVCFPGCCFFCRDLSQGEGKPPQQTNGNANTNANDKDDKKRTKNKAKKGRFMRAVRRLLPAAPPVIHVFGGEGRREKMEE